MSRDLTVEPYLLPSPGEMPEALVDWDIRPRQATLLIHDMQRYFLSPFPDAMRSEIVGNVRDLHSWAQRVGAATAYTAQPGRMNVTDRGLLRDFWGPGMQTTDADRALVPELELGDDAWPFVKWRYSAFHRSDLLARMRENGRTQLVLCGVYAHVGILATALDAYTHDIEVFLVGDAVADFTAADHRHTLEYTSRCCARVVATKWVTER
ncbi:MULTISPECIES: isochorismatase family protein [Rhodococcus]|uniref:isochorismatase family protein n=1 Tax=Rhodococcus TaxID=1827 RepID=UPI0006419CAE|nr:isochorismatase family protein [Rhodococcus qingshengii]KLN71592.1 isochorismatase [Rhodococcus erythropolis]KSU60278.1 isochorismatase [Rhodococcus qingshengii]NHP18338.1 isochorismatase family protein [Rhodococcus sp. IC4_135]SCC70465.1 Isochorismate hydrolase [Rhodococcus qingshengii]